MPRSPRARKSTSCSHGHVRAACLACCVFVSAVRRSRALHVARKEQRCPCSVSSRWHPHVFGYPCHGRLALDQASLGAMCGTHRRTSGGMQEWFLSEGVLEANLPMLSSPDSMIRLKGLLLASSVVRGHPAALVEFCKQAKAISSVLSLVRSSSHAGSYHGQAGACHSRSAHRGRDA